MCYNLLSIIYRFLVSVPFLEFPFLHFQSITSINSCASKVARAASQWSLQELSFDVGWMTSGAMVVSVSHASMG